MELSVAELNELIYAVGIAKNINTLANISLMEQLESKLRDELEKAIQE